MTKTLPHEVIMEIIGHFHFSTNPDQDLGIAENLAGNSYSSLEEVYDACLSQVNVRLKRKVPKLGDFQDNPYFKLYLKSASSI